MVLGASVVAWSKSMSWQRPCRVIPRVAVLDHTRCRSLHLGSVCGYDSMLNVLRVYEVLTRLGVPLSPLAMVKRVHDTTIRTLVV